MVASGQEEEGKPLVQTSSSNGLTTVFNLDASERRARVLLGMPASVVAGGAYCFSSMSMVRNNPAHPRRRHPPSRPSRRCSLASSVC